VSDDGAGVSDDDAAVSDDGAGVRGVGVGDGGAGVGDGDGGVGGAGTGRSRATAVGAVAAVVLLLGPAAVRIAIALANPTLSSLDIEPSATADSLHATLTVADLHADALLWDRSLLDGGRIGHVDLPRLLEGRVAVQLFTAVTQSPAGQNIEANPSDSDLIWALTLLQGWPPRTWDSRVERALHQAHKLRGAAARSGGRLVVATSRDELDAALTRHADGDEVVVGLLGIEGAHALDGDLASLDRVYDAGFRMIGLTHFFDNAVGGSAHGEEKGGLTDFGREVLAKMEMLGIAIDLAHASPALIDDVLAVATTPVLVSHTGVKATCDNRRNLDDGRLRGIAETGGVVGIGLWPTAVCGERPADWARAVRHAVDIAGIEHVGLGSDWDGAVAAIVDAAGTVHLVEALLREGFADGEIGMIMGGNVIRVLRETLPERTDAGG
jgi:microsomal dipeptidase-like Zn-dependent dipeptidase